MRRFVIHGSESVAGSLVIPNPPGEANALGGSPCARSCERVRLIRSLDGRRREIGARRRALRRRLCRRLSSLVRCRELRRRLRQSRRLTRRSASRDVRGRRPAAALCSRLSCASRSNRAATSAGCNRLQLGRQLLPLRLFGRLSLRVRATLPLRKHGLSTRRTRLLSL